MMKTDIIDAFTNTKDKISTSLTSCEKELNANDPKRQLKLGYSIATVNGKILKSTNQLQKGNTVTVGLNNGSFESEVTIINKSNQ